jgi:hypothetical protein
MAVARQLCGQEDGAHSKCNAFVSEHKQNKNSNFSKTIKAIDFVFS